MSIDSTAATGSNTSSATGTVTPEHRALNIAIISDAAPGRNGVGTFYIDLQEHLKDRVGRIELFSPTIEENGKWNAGLVLPLPGDATQKLCFPNPFTLQRQLQALRPDIVIIATPGVYGLLGAFLAGRMKIPAIAGFHTSFEAITDLYWANSTAGKVVHGYFKVSNLYLFKKCKLVMANSQVMIDQARQLKAPATELIHTIISPAFTGHPVTPATGKLQRILFAGRLAPEKNIEAILQAARSLPQFHFTLAGDGPLRDTVQKAADELDNLTLLDWLKRETLREEIDRHDALILPSHFESFGTIALEAMARQRLVVVSPQCGIADWPSFRAGLFVMEDQNLTEALNRIARLSDDQRREKSLEAQQLTRALNDTSIAQWLALLARYSSADTEK